MPVTDRHPVRAQNDEREVLERLSREIKQHFDDRERGVAVLMNDETTLEIPPSLFRILSEAVAVLLEGDAVAILPYHQEMTTQEAADYLGVSRPYLISLLEKENIPYHNVGTHRRIYLRDIEVYREQRDAKRRATLDKLTRDAYELGLYDVPVSERG